MALPSPLSYPPAPATIKNNNLLVSSSSHSCLPPTYNQHLIQDLINDHNSLATTTFPLTSNYRANMATVPSLDTTLVDHQHSHVFHLSLLTYNIISDSDKLSHHNLNSITTNSQILDMKPMLSLSNMEFHPPLHFPSTTVPMHPFPPGDPTSATLALVTSQPILHTSLIEYQDMDSSPTILQLELLNATQGNLQDD